METGERRRGAISKQLKIEKQNLRFSCEPPSPPGFLQTRHFDSHLTAFSIFIHHLNNFCSSLFVDHVVFALKEQLLKRPGEDLESIEQY